MVHRPCVGSSGTPVAHGSPAGFCADEAGLVGPNRELRPACRQPGAQYRRSRTPRGSRHSSRAHRDPTRPRPAMNPIRCPIGDAADRLLSGCPAWPDRPPRVCCGVPTRCRPHRAEQPAVRRAPADAGIGAVVCPSEPCSPIRCSRHNLSQASPASIGCCCCCCCTGPGEIRQLRSPAGRLGLARGDPAARTTRSSRLCARRALRPGRRNAEGELRTAATTADNLSTGASPAPASIGNQRQRTTPCWVVLPTSPGCNR